MQIFHATLVKADSHKKQVKVQLGSQNWRLERPPLLVVRLPWQQTYECHSTSRIKNPNLKCRYVRVRPSSSSSNNTNNKKATLSRFHFSILTATSETCTTSHDAQDVYLSCMPASCGKLLTSCHLKRQKQQRAFVSDANVTRLKGSIADTPVPFLCVEEEEKKKRGLPCQM